MILAILEILIGLAILGWSADRMVDNASDIARHYGMSSLMIGLTIVAFGTSAPEMVVSIMAVLSDSGPLAVGNALGSNIANTGLILGTAALLAPLTINKNLCARELPLLMVLTLAAGFFLLDLQLIWIEGLILLIGQGVFFFLLYHFNKPQHVNPDLSAIIEEAAEAPAKVEKGVTNLWASLLMNLALLLVSSKILVLGASTLAELIGIPESIIGVTIVALGTSLPELAATVASIKKKQHDMAIGNIIGSNIMNLTLVLSMTGLLKPTIIDAEVATRDAGVMILLTISLFLCALFSLRKGQVNRGYGILWVTTYVLYMAYLVIHHLPKQAPHQLDASLDRLNDEQTLNYETQQAL